ncbi:PREDICTED: uncharacterized protein LOC106727046 [Myotis brandtii]|uniref:uncharacterized protein LOC106727046 n=1 Tax=Myotis brandtii TaxID=109478 RepID=UPI000704250C|nr:PREDICTED: uncharacterized protein LOC106727046 [Myotis brandtii]
MQKLLHAQPRNCLRIPGHSRYQAPGPDSSSPLERLLCIARSAMFLKPPALQESGQGHRETSMDRLHSPQWHILSLPWPVLQNERRYLCENVENLPRNSSGKADLRNAVDSCPASPPGPRRTPTRHAFPSPPPMRLPGATGTDRGHALEAPVQELSHLTSAVFSKRSASARSYHVSSAHTQPSLPATHSTQEAASHPEGFEKPQTLLSPPPAPDSPASCLCPILLGEEGALFSKGAQVA